MELLRLNRAVGLLQVLDGDLGLPIGPRPPQFAILAHVSELLAQLGRHGVREWHAVLSLISRVAEHDALVTSANVKVLLPNMDAASNVGALLVDAHEHFARLVAQALAVNAGK